MMNGEEISKQIDKVEKEKGLLNDIQETIKTIDNIKLCDDLNSLSVYQVGHYGVCYLTADTDSKVLFSYLKPHLIKFFENKQSKLEAELNKLRG